MRSDVIEAENVAQLAVFAPNWLGDAVMALPAIDDVRKAMPAAVVTIVARPSVAPLFSLVPGLERPVVLPRGMSGRAGSLELLRARTFDAALLLPNSFQSGLTAWRAGIPARWGYRTDCRGPLLTRAVSRPGRTHQGAYYQHLVRALGFRNGPLEPRLEVTAEGREAASGLLMASGWDGRTPLVALAPGAAYGGAKRWPLDSFAAVAEHLCREGAAVVLVGSGDDAASAEELMSRLGAAGSLAFDLTGRTDLPALAGVLVTCRTLVTNDSGAMHVGAALGVQVIAMFGPTDERATHPLGSGHTVLTHPTWCRPCMLRECPLNHHCMRGISVDVVLAAARRTI